VDLNLKGRVAVAAGGASGAGCRLDRVKGKSTMNLGIYTGPGTPPNTDWHHYTWTLIATDLDPKALQPGMTREELAAALKDHVKGSAGLVTRFRHPT
jgi:phosphatidylethanolamine-binding protein (PEBP) family uncharacterized protein